MPGKFTSVVLMMLAASCPVVGMQERSITVAQDGTGDFTTVQGALNSVPRDNQTAVTIRIRNGIYVEKLYLVSSHVMLIGEDREKTRIVFAELREHWVNAHDSSDWGSATVNLDSSITDITFANLTIRNNYGSLFGVHGHQFAIRGGGTRVKLLNCTVSADGGDTVSLWNRESGMYYHAYCSFEGWVDYVCPRGWCFIMDSEFFGHNLSASIWHDGSADRNQKFVIRSSRFDGVPGFPLGRHHRDGQFYLIDCRFASTMKDTPIYLPVSPNARPWIWGKRHYYFQCHREGRDFAWYADNLETAEGSPAPDQITPEWTFAGTWDPEAEISAILPFAAFPRPRNGERNVSSGGTLLRWIPAEGASHHRVWIRSSTGWSCVDETAQPRFAIGSLLPGMEYQWRVDEIVGREVRTGRIWSFVTEGE